MQNEVITINRSSSVLISPTHLHYKFGIVNETEKIIPLQGIKRLNYSSGMIDKTSTGCNIFAGFFAGILSDYPDPGNVETNLPVLTIEYYPEGHRWPKFLKISQPDLSEEKANKIWQALGK